MAYLDLSKIQKDSETTIETSFYNFKLNQKIEDLFLVNENLILVSKTKIFHVDIFECPMKVFLTELFDNVHRTGTSYEIKDAKYSKTHGLFYLLLRNEDATDSLIFRFKSDLEMIKETIIKKISKQIKFFEISNLDEDVLYVGTKNEVFEINLVEDIRNSVQKNMLPSQRSLTRGQSEIGKPRKSKVNNNNIKQNNITYKRIYKMPKEELLFFKFDAQMKYFYVHDQKNIKKILFKSNTLVKTYSGHEEKIKNIFFTLDNQFMIV